MSWKGNNSHQHIAPRPSKEKNLGKLNSRKNSTNPDDVESYHEKKQRQLSRFKKQHNLQHHQPQNRRPKNRNICNNCYEPDCEHRSRNMSHCSILQSRIAKGKR